MPSAVEIVNMAFVKIGADQIISLTEDSTNARKANAVYDFLRKSVLREHQWNFAVKRVECAVLSETPTFGYDYYYQLPSDCLRVLRLEDDTEFRVEGSKIATDESPCNIEYISDVTDCNSFDPMFVDSFSARITAELCYSITSDLNLAKGFLEEYKMKISLAKSKSSQENTPISVRADEWLNSRY